MNYVSTTYNVIQPMDVFDIRNLFIAYIYLGIYVHILFDI